MKPLAYEQSYDTDENTIPLALRRFISKRALELAGCALFTGLIGVGLSLASWSANDPSMNIATNQKATNLLGSIGAIVADTLLQNLGLAALVFMIVPMAWVVMLFKHRLPAKIFMSLLMWVLAFSASAAAFSVLPTYQSWPLAGGFGGSVGDIIAGGLARVLSLGIKGFLANLTVFLGCGALALWSALRAMELSSQETTAVAGSFGARIQDLWSPIAGAFQHLFMRRQQKASYRSTTQRREPSANKKPARAEDDILSRLAPSRLTGGKSNARVEPNLLNTKSKRKIEPLPEPDEFEPEDDQELIEDDFAEDIHAESELDEHYDEELEAEPDAAPTALVTRSTVEIKTGKKLSKDLQPSIKIMRSQSFELPPLTLLAEPKKPTKSAAVSNEILEQNARMLEGVLEDFGVRGQIINVKPGPVVTLYELEPAPGIKSSRVISLADDIARSMSAISARVAVVQGRNVIGIELPNAKRETVYLRELLASEAFEKTTQNLSMALGKNIGGEPIFADLARMPHLLIAGTTGSGKSVGINTMILSLLYRLPPERCRLIMIDPKMLELSVYEGIPHLLAPVVTDPRKAVVALKWAVREMEDRYRKMSKLGVRNIDGFNERVKQSTAKGQKMSRTVQTGFNSQSGEAIFEKEEMDLVQLPYIVVIIDEMADLMMVAGKDIEGAVQRLAQMARAAGIHVVMATQRPSVDVITGTIKANFPTRISFQVTSKIDSRTILGEMGAEQLLGQGDMLYMAGGGRISRLHGPFVADEEVEKIVSFLKSQGTPEYIDAVTEEAEEEAYGEAGAMAGVEGGGSGDELYDQAVAVVLRDKKVSTSYVQRRLQVGYNKAASLIERMEKEGLISASNATGKREILVPGDSARD